ncbi:MAG: M23 family metallopeptidase [Pseudomonadota bacterium]
MSKPKFARWALALSATALAASACTPNRPAEAPPPPPPLATASGQPSTSPSTPTVDASGIVTYDGFQAAQARDGDTVATLAARLGLSATALGAYNGRAPDDQLQLGDEMALPPRPGGYGPGGASVTATAPAATQPPPPETGIVQRPLGTPGAETGTASSGGIPVSDDGAPVVTDPAAVAAGTAPANPAAAPDAAAPVETTWSPELAAAAIARSSGINPDGSLGPPPSAGTPVPTEPETGTELESPDLGQYQSQGTAEAALPPVPEAAPPAESQVAAAPASTPQIRLRRPVDGPIAIGFNKGAGPARNDGVDFAAPAGAPVVAAADGEVALVSESLGGLGTIVLVRHPNELLTVYGRIDDVTVQKGDIVQSGQQIGVVSDAAAPAEPRMHFEVRRGAESLDPTLFL